MNDLPSQTVLQQNNARPVSGSELEVLGKKASAQYLQGCSPNLSEAVVETVKSAGLSPEQVKRVVEFANTDAYLKEFEKKGATHKYIDFEGGPANPAEVIKDLNDGGGGTVFDRGDGDYASGPTLGKTAEVLQLRNRRAMGLEKVAEVPLTPAETAFEQMWEAEDTPLQYAEPLNDSIDMKEKLAAAADHFRAEIDMLESSYLDTVEDLYGQVKQASLGGVPLGHILQAWSLVVPGEGFVKVAFAHIGKRLMREGVFETGEELGDSLEKTASGLVDTEHPLVTNFAAFCLNLEKLAEARAAHDKVSTHLGEVTEFLKQAGRVEDMIRAGGAIPKALRSIWGGAGKLGQKLKAPVGKAFGALGGPGAQRVGEAVGEYGPKALLAGTGLALGESAYQKAVKHGPLGYGLSVAKSRMPGTQEYYIRQSALAQNPGLF
jgi:hypothetical protein